MNSTPGEARGLLLDADVLVLDRLAAKLYVQRLRNGRLAHADPRGAVAVDRQRPARRRHHQQQRCDGHLRRFAAAFALTSARSRLGSSAEDTSTMRQPK